MAEQPYVPICVAKTRLQYAVSSLNIAWLQASSRLLDVALRSATSQCTDPCGSSEPSDASYRYILVQLRSDIPRCVLEAPWATDPGLSYKRRPLVARWTILVSRTARCMLYWKLNICCVGYSRVELLDKPVQTIARNIVVRSASGIIVKRSRLDAPFSTWV